MIETPLVVELIRDWDATYTVEGEDSYLSCRTKQGVKILYQQLEIGERKDGSKSYVEFVTFQKGHIEHVEDVRLIRKDKMKYLIEEGYNREYSSPTFSLSDTVKRVLETYVRDEFADRFAEGFCRIFDRIKGSDYEHLMILRDNDFVYLGDRRFLKIVREEDDLKKGLKKAYIQQHKEGVTQSGSVQSIDDIVKGLPRRSPSLILTSGDPAVKLVSSPFFEEDYLSTSTLYMSEMLLGLTEFLDGLMTVNIYEFLAGRFKVSKETVLEAVSVAEGSKTVKLDDQVKGMKRRLKESEESDDEALTIEEAILLEDITAEMTEYSTELMIYQEYDWWKRIKDVAGMVFEGNMDDARQKSRRSDWIRRVKDVFERCDDTISGMHYDSLMHISPRRLPGSGGAWKNKRRGVGNMLLDLGSREALYGIEAEHIEDNLHWFNAYLFRGDILKPVLTRKLPDHAKVVAIDTCAERVHELARFCGMENAEGGDPHTLVYSFPHQGVEREVRLVMANEEARRAVEGLRSAEEQKDKDD